MLKSMNDAFLRFLKICSNVKTRSDVGENEFHDVKRFLSSLDVSDTLSVDEHGWATVHPPRPSWDEIWMSIAHVLASRSIDPRTKVGVLVVASDNSQVMSIGYNGDQKGGSNTVESYEPGKSGTIHGEENCLIKLDYNNPKKKIMYVTVSPCDMCAKKIINADISEVVYDCEYRDRSGIDRLLKAGIKTRNFKLHETS